MRGNKSKLSAPAGGDDPESGEEDPDDFFDRRVLKPLPDMANGEMRELAGTIQREIYLRNPNVRFAGFYFSGLLLLLLTFVLLFVAFTQRSEVILC